MEIIIIINKMEQTRRGKDRVLDEVNTLYWIMGIGTILAQSVLQVHHSSSSPNYFSSPFATSLTMSLRNLCKFWLSKC